MNYPYLNENRFKKPNVWIQQAIYLSNLFYPNCCIACTNSLFRYEIDLCLKCWKKIPFNIANSINSSTLKIDPVHFLCYYSKKSVVHSLIHSIKYSSNQQLAKKMGQLLGEQLNTNHVEIDTILPVPMHPKKRILRGFNQAEYIAQGIRAVIKKPIQTPQVVIKTVFTETQTKKDHVERWKNTQNVFKVIEPKKIINQRILIVDDVYTTGATYTSLRKTLEESNVHSVQLAVLAFAEKR